MEKEIKIGTKTVGENNPCYIIAEAGVNHNGRLDLAKKLVDIAIASGVDAVKFQKRDIDSILTKEAKTIPYGGPHSFGQTYYDHRKALELNNFEFRELKKYCDHRNMTFLASGWDMESVDILEEINVHAFKIASADLTNIPLLEYVANKNKPILVSTGMSDMNELECAVKTIDRINKEHVLLHCVSVYPSSFKNINLNVIKTLKKSFGPLVGYSGHEFGIAISLAAVVMGAVVLERHFTIDRTMKGGDHAASLEPQGLFKLVRDIRSYEKSLGSFKKECLDVEIPIRNKLAKSLVSTKYVPKGTIITEEMLTVKSPGTGLSPARKKNLIGKKARIHIEEDSTLLEEMIEW